MPGPKRAARPARWFALALDADGNPTWIADETGGLPGKAWSVSPDNERFAVVEAAWSTPVRGARELCIRFSGDTRPAMWVLDTVTLLPDSVE